MQVSPCLIVDKSRDPRGRLCSGLPPRGQSQCRPPIGARRFAAASVDSARCEMGARSRVDAALQHSRSAALTSELPLPRHCRRVAAMSDWRGRSRLGRATARAARVFGRASHCAGLFGHGGMPGRSRPRPRLAASAAALMILSRRSFAAMRVVLSSSQSSGSDGVPASPLEPQPPLLPIVAQFFQSGQRLCGARPVRQSRDSRRSPRSISLTARLNSLANDIEHLSRIPAGGIVRNAHRRTPHQAFGRRTL